MGKLLANEKEIVIPGEQVAEGMDFVPGTGTYRKGEFVTASILGLLSIEGRMVKIIPVSGKYLPQRGDTIIGRIKDVTMSGWIVDINSAYDSMLGLKEASSEFIRKGADLTRYFNFGEYIETKIINVTTQNVVDLTMKMPGLRKLGEGMIINVNPSKVPRIIGKQGSMVSMIKKETNCRIVVGQNGIVWIQGEPEKEIIAANVIKKIERESHTSGLTDRISTFLTGEVKNDVRQEG